MPRTRGMRTRRIAANIAKRPELLQQGPKPLLIEFKGQQSYGPSSMTTLISAPLFEIIFVYPAALFLTVATLWVLPKTIPRDELRDTRSFFVLIIAVVPFLMLICFGSAVIIDDTIDRQVGWPPDLPLESQWPAIWVGALIYTGLTLWLWWRWRKLQAERIAANVAKLPQLVRKT